MRLDRELIKKHFLSRMTNERGRYKRYTGLPLRYAGGKTQAVGYVVEQLPDDLRGLVSPFFGGGSVEFACAQELGMYVQGYDIFTILVNYWKVQLESSEMLADQLANWQPIPEDYDYVKRMLKRHWSEGWRISPLYLAALYYFNHNLSYGPGFLGWMSSNYTKPGAYQRMVERVREFKCHNVDVDVGDFADVIPSHDTDFLYCDPPYFLDGDSKMFRGIYPQRNFPVHHDGFAHEKLRDLLHDHKSGFVLSYNDCTPIREWYKDFNIIPVEWQYTMGQGETRIGKHRPEGNHVKQSHEILIVKR